MPPPASWLGTSTARSGTSRWHTHTHHTGSRRSQARHRSRGGQESQGGHRRSQRAKGAKEAKEAKEEATEGANTKLHPLRRLDLNGVKSQNFAAIRVYLLHASLTQFLSSRPVTATVHLVSQALILAGIDSKPHMSSCIIVITMRGHQCQEIMTHLQLRRAPALWCPGHQHAPEPLHTAAPRQPQC